VGREGTRAHLETTTVNTAPATRSPAAAPATVKIGGSEYRRTGAPCYHVQIQSYRGGYLSTAAVTRNRAHVGGFARGQAEILTTWGEARRPCFSDGILIVTDQELRGVSGYNQGRAATLSTYRWDPTTGRWAYSTGTRIEALDALEAATTPAWTLAD
jgi:hypothetical protein